MLIMFAEHLKYLKPQFYCLIGKITVFTSNSFYINTEFNKTM